MLLTSHVWPLSHHFCRRLRSSMVASEHDARNLIDRYKEEVMAEVTAGYMKEMAAMVLGFGLPGTRRAAMEKLEKEASEACTLHALKPGNSASIWRNHHGPNSPTSRTHWRSQTRLAITRLLLTASAITSLSSRPTRPPQSSARCAPRSPPMSGRACTTSGSSMKRCSTMSARCRSSRRCLSRSSRGFLPSASCTAI